MRLLLDECVDWRLLRDLDRYEAATTKQRGWLHLDDAALLRVASAEFDVLLTVDKDLPREQDVARFDIAVVVLRGRTTRLADLRALMDDLHAALPNCRPGEVLYVAPRDFA